ncbi:hypothetical protein V6N13_028892 [Hibiscus sabdariffa]
MAPKGTCRGRSTRVGQVARAALKRNFHRAAGRILCRRLKYATGYFPTLIPDVHSFASDSIFCYADKGESHAL